MRRITIFFSLSLFLLIASTTASAQIQNGVVKGTVSDPSGARVSRVEVTLDNSLTGFHATSVTDEQGEYLFDNVPFGSYVLRANTIGFQSVRQTVSVRSNIPLLTNVQLGVAGISETVSVVADEPLVQPDSSSTATTVDESFIRRLPGAADGRQLQNVIATTPGWRTENDGLLPASSFPDPRVSA